MAAPSLNHQPAFLIFPTLSREYTWKIVATETNRFISRHKNLKLAVKKAERLNLAAAESFCTFEDSRYEFACGKSANVVDIETRRPLCARHFESVSA